MGTTRYAQTQLPLRTDGDEVCPLRDCRTVTSEMKIAEIENRQASVMAVSPPELPVIDVVSPLDDPKWDELVAVHPDCCFFHGAAWARVLHDSYGQEPNYFVVRKDGALTGLLPITQVRSVLTGLRGVSLAFSDFCPPLGLDRATYRDLWQRILVHGRERRWKSLEVRGGYDLMDSISSWNCFYGHTLDLTVGEERLLKGFESRVRGAIRKAESSGLKVEIDRSLEALGEFYRLHCQTRRSHGVPPQPWLFFHSIHRNILARQQGMVVLARWQGRPVAGAVFFHLGKKVIYKFSASDAATRQLRPNNLVLWEAIRSYARSGYSEMHFGRTSMSNDGLRLYKRGFGTQEHQIHYFRYEFQTGTFRSGKEQPPDWKNRLCSSMPVSLLRLAGRILYRHMS